MTYGEKSYQKIFSGKKMVIYLYCYAKTLKFKELNYKKYENN